MTVYPLLPFHYDSLTPSSFFHHLSSPSTTTIWLATPLSPDSQERRAGERRLVEKEGKLRVVHKGLRKERYRIHKSEMVGPCRSASIVWRREKIVFVYESCSKKSVQEESKRDMHSSLQFITMPLNHYFTSLLHAHARWSLPGWVGQYHAHIKPRGTAINCWYHCQLSFFCYLDTVQSWYCMVSD